MATALLILVSLACMAGGFGYLVHKIGWKPAVAAVSALGVGVWAGGEQIVSAFATFVGMFGG